MPGSACRRRAGFSLELQAPTRACILRKSGLPFHPSGFQIIAMSKNNAIIVVVALVAVIVVAFVFVFRDSATIRAVLPFDTEVSLQGHNELAPQPGNIEGKGLEAGGDLTAKSHTGGDVKVEDAKAEGNIELSTREPGSDGDPKE